MRDREGFLVVIFVSNALCQRVPFALTLSTSLWSLIIITNSYIHARRSTRVDVFSERGIYALERGEF